MKARDTTNSAGSRKRAGAWLIKVSAPDKLPRDFRRRYAAGPLGGLGAKKLVNYSTAVSRERSCGRARNQYTIAISGHTGARVV